MFLKRLVEEAFHAFVAGTAAVLATGGDVDTALLVAAVAAGGRAVLGVVVKHVGTDSERPSAN